MKKFYDSDNVFFKLLEKNNHIIYILDKDNNIIYISNSIHKSLEYDNEELIGKNIFDLVDPKDASALRDVLDHISDDMEMATIQLKDKDDISYSFLLSNFPYEFEAEKGSAGILIDTDHIGSYEIDYDLQKLTNAVNQSPVSIVITDSDYSVEFLNSRFTEMTGYKESSIINNKINILDLGENYNQVDEEILDSIHAGDVWKGDVQICRKDGLFYWESVLISPILDKKGLITHYVRIGEDISNQKNLFNMLIRSYDFIEGLMDNINPLFVTDENYTILQTNKLFSDTFGYSAAEIVGRKFLEIIHPDQMAEIKKYLGSVVSKTSLTDFIETVIKSKNEIDTYVTLKCAPFINEGEDLYIVGAIQDVTEKKKVEIGLQKLSRAVEHSPASVVITDTDGNIEYVNPKFTSLTGYSLEEVIGKNPKVLKSGEQTGEFYKKMWETILSGNEWRGEFHNRKKNGDLYWEFASISPLRNDKEEVTHFIAVKEDVTERKKAEESLQISEDNLRKKNHLMQRELEYAQIVIKKLLPEEPPEIKNLKIDFKYTPLEEIGGDYFSLMPMSDGDGLGVFIGDIAGHGVSSALFLSLIKSVTDRLFKDYPDDSSIYLDKLNKELSVSMPTYFLTAIYGNFKSSKKGMQFSFSKAGHPSPILYRKETGSLELLKSKGGLIGFFDELEFEKVTIDLLPGDRIFLYTDGIVETVNMEKDMLMYEGLKDIIKNYSSLSLEKLLQAIIKSVSSFKGDMPDQDDLILLGFEVTQ